MFEDIKEPKNSRSMLWKVLPLAVLVFAAIVGVAVYFSYKAESQPPDLTGVIRKGHPDFDWYSKYVMLNAENQKIKLGQNYLGDKVVMFSGLIENGGEKTLDVVEVKLVLFNYEKPVWETVRTPIRPDGRMEPIPPLGKRSFSLYVETLPAAWDAGQAEMWITGFRFKK